MPPMGFALQGYVDTGKPWSEKATADEKLDTLHQQSEELRGRIDDLRTRHDRDRSSAQKEIREAESRLAAQIRQVRSEMSGERSQASHVDARGLLPVALGIIMTGLPDELAKVPAVGMASSSSSAYLDRVHIPWLASGLPGGPEDGRDRRSTRQRHPSQQQSGQQRREQQAASIISRQHPATLGHSVTTCGMPGLESGRSATPAAHDPEDMRNDSDLG